MQAIRDTTICCAKRRMPSAAVTMPWAVQSTGEKAAVALVLNRADWLAEHGYTIAEAIERTGPEWVAMIPQVARQLAEEE